MSDLATDQLLASSENVGRWMAWNREQTRLLAIGNTFEEAKLAAAATGEQSVTMARLTTSGPRRKPRWAHVMAVFVAMTPGLNFATSGDDARSDAPTSVSTCATEDDIAAPTGCREDRSSHRIG